MESKHVGKSETSATELTATIQDVKEGGCVDINLGGEKNEMKWNIFIFISIGIYFRWDDAKEIYLNIDISISAVPYDILGMYIYQNSQHQNDLKYQFQTWIHCHKTRMENIHNECLHIQSENYPYDCLQLFTNFPSQDKLVLMWRWRKEASQSVSQSSFLWNTYILTIYKWADLERIKKKAI